MESRAAADDAGAQSFRVMPWWLVLVGFGIAVVSGVVVTWWLLGIAGSGGSAGATVRIDAIRTGLTAVAGTGGAVGLVLLARRQWLNERTQRHREYNDAVTRAHQERVQAHAEASVASDQAARDRAAASSEYDAIERRVTELFGKAVEHLGSDKAPVRLGGLYALERLAQNNEQYRQTIVDVVCAYLRMPAREEVPDEQHVRLGAQRMLTRHLRPGPDHWEHMRIDLIGAYLDGFDASRCVFDDVDFTGATFAGATSFDDSGFHGETRFRAAVFRGDVSLQRTRWRHSVDFGGAQWHQNAYFAEATFEHHARFDHATFGGKRTSFRAAIFQRTATFDRSRLTGDATFHGTRFERNMSFEHVTCDSAVSYRDAVFVGMTMFRRTVFHGQADFGSATFGEYVAFDKVHFAGGVMFDRQPIERMSAVETRIAAKSLCQLPDGWALVPIDDEQAGLTRKG